MQTKCTNCGDISPLRTDICDKCGSVSFKPLVDNDKRTIGEIVGAKKAETKSTKTESAKTERAEEKTVVTEDVEVEKVESKKTANKK